ncbi:protein Iojap-related, mitochondrial [Impatiens glandulifera]|uniref:protein Iojap-related, mitochondrial n=1 Tax=Impatiens glandulifera TaxID=253017 RepID=UPI001FB123BC|nr:protein Iojap-related, mitochondrial [Impatiens glandulifera]
MLAALRSRVLSFSSTSSSASVIQPLWKLHSSTFNNRTFCSSDVDRSLDLPSSGLLNLAEVEKILEDVKADDVKVVQVRDQCDWADYMVFASGRSAWHVRNIAQALIYKVKQKQRGAERMLLPVVEGEKEGKWIVVDSGPIVVHALDEKARSYYNLERLWIPGASNKEQPNNLGEAFLKVRRINNSKKKVQNLD